MLGALTSQTPSSGSNLEERPLTLTDSKTCQLFVPSEAFDYTSISSLVVTLNSDIHKLPKKGDMDFGGFKFTAMSCQEIASFL